MSLLGAAAIGIPPLAEVFVGALAGWLLWLAGAIMLFACIFLIAPKPLLGGVISSLAAVLAGMFLLFNPTVGALAVAILAAGAFTIDGAFQLALALNLRPLGVWRWVLSSAIASILAAIVIGSKLTTLSADVFGAMAGLAVLSTGGVFIALSTTPRRP